MFVSESHLYLNPLCVPQHRTVTTALLQGPVMAAEMACITVRYASAAVLRVHLEEPALHISVLSHELSQCLVKLNRERDV